MGKYYVYAAYGVDDELLYVGKGSGNRYQHCINGCSSVKDLNRYYFRNGEDGSIKVSKLKSFNKESEALKYEVSCIQLLKPLFNKVHNDKPNYVSKANLTVKEKLLSGFILTMDEYLQEYFEAVNNKDAALLSYISEKQPIVKDAFEFLDSEILLKGGVFRSVLEKKIKEAKTPDPLIKSESCEIYNMYTPYNVELNLLQQALQDLGKLDTTPSKLSKNSKKVKLYALCTTSKEMTNQEMADILGVSLRTVKYWLKELRELGVID